MDRSGDFGLDTLNPHPSNHAGGSLTAVVPGLAQGIDRAIGVIAAGSALAATVVLAIADLVLTIDIASTHGLLEANPLARALATYAGAQGLVVWKLSTLTLGVWILSRYRRRRLARAAAMLALVAHVWMMGQWSRYMDAMHQAHSGAVASAVADHQLAITL